MKTRLVLIVVATIVTLLVVLPAPLQAQDPGKPAPIGLRPDAPPYALHGPYWVGSRDFVIGEDTERPLLVHAWYPALNPEGLAETVTYQTVIKDATLPPDLEVDARIFGHALWEVATDMGSAPYPLIVFSPGFGASSYVYAHLVEHWASYGFVILSPEHQEMFEWTFADLPTSTFERPHDIVQTLDYAETLTAEGGTWAGLVDMERVAVAGHSYGGYTALAMGGARFDLAGFNARCAALATDDPAQFLCAPLVPVEQDMVTMAGLDAMPEGLWPALGDPRVDAIIPMASDSYLFDQAGLAEITMPMMAMGGTLDNGTPYAWGAGPAYQYAASATKALVAFEGGDHMIFGQTCSNMPYIEGVNFSYWFCMDSVWDKLRVHDLIHHFSTAFLLSQFYGDSDAAAALAADVAAFPGVTYQVQGY